ncbi:hypothetical protein [Baaleninema simplex]|uniref:hypothetical protein n=1 Tax=Baaleninema simplex TaxID=2862350 RepID=UPI00034CB7BA|nr:hypothetical protein [Baaleninema simplex]
MQIDNYEEAQKLTEKIKSHLPIDVTLTPAMCDRLNKQMGANLKKGQICQVNDVQYSGDMGGILCDLKMPESSDNFSALTSITHVRVTDDCPLADEIRSYQEKRTIRLAIQDRKLGKVRRLQKKKAKQGKGFG